jgi:hypothetical protein
LDKDAKQIEGIITEPPREESSVLILKNGIKIIYNQFESWWQSADIPSEAQNKKEYSTWLDKVYKNAGGPDKARTSELNPFKYK